METDYTSAELLGWLMWKIPTKYKDFLPVSGNDLRSCFLANSCSQRICLYRVLDRKVVKDYLDAVNIILCIRHKIVDRR
jgi:hypothetical protein